MNLTGTEQIVAEDSEGLGDFQVNPNMLEYGSRIAEITDFRVIDDKGRCSNTVEKEAASNPYESPV